MSNTPQLLTLAQRAEIAARDKASEPIHRFYHSCEDRRALCAHADAADAEIARLREALYWALGENGEFADRPAGAGLYWWRRELRNRCKLPVKALAEDTQ